MGPPSKVRDIPRFAPFHKADRIFFPALLAWIWVGILAGFVPAIITHITQHKPGYLWIVHVHSPVFVGWLALLTAQLTLIRIKNVALHRRIGVIGAYWAVALVIIGVITSVMVDRSFFATRRWDPQFFSVQLADLVLFAILTGFALALRREAPAHKRLMLLGTVALSNAGFSRWWAPALAHWLGAGYFSELAQDYAGDFLIIALMLLYDTVTRGRPNGALARGATLIVLGDVLAVYLYFNPGWIALTDRLLRP
jgi:hypothetical protein